MAMVEGDPRLGPLKAVIGAAWELHAEAMKPTQTAIARKIGTSQETVSRRKERMLRAWHRFASADPGIPPAMSPCRGPE